MTMTLSEIAAWEKQLLADHDLTDLADTVQLLRTLAWSARLGMKPGLPTERAFIWHENLHEFGPTIDLLRQRAAAADAPEDRAMCETLARLYAAVRDALAAGPVRPSDDELVWRYVSGEIGDRTAQYVAGWDSYQLIEECQRRGLPPLQMGDDR